MQNKIEISAKKSFNYGWELLKLNWEKILPMALISMFITFSAEIINFLIEKPYLVESEYGVREVVGMPGLFVILTVFISLVSFILTVIIAYNLTKIYFSVLDKKEYQVKDLFMKVDNNFWQWVIANIVLGITVILGLILFIIPGIYFALRFGYTPYLVIDKSMNWKEAFTMSTKMTQDYKWNILGFNIVMMLYALGIILLGLLCLIIGVLPAIFIVSFVTYIAQMKVYRDLYDNLNGKTIIENAN